MPAETQITQAQLVDLCAAAEV
ncbi:MAG: hypothetical protein QOF32_924, partial [Gammaproteobacteria bacterium]|nr:hypothetical protein [Gammaproteobacteria bacterium]